VNLASPAFEARRRATIVRALRCMLVSVGTTALSATIIVALTIGAGAPAGTANVIAVICGIGPSYVANRRWVWGRDGRGDFAREAAPFWTLSVLGLVLSTVLVARVAHIVGSWPAADRAFALPAANLSAFALLWLAQFVVLDRVIFRERAPREIASRADAGVDTEWEIS
jgi:putative flippase GtrA